MMVIKLLM